MNELMSFSAEKALYKTKRRYLMGSSNDNQGSLITPALDSSYDDGGSAILSNYTATVVPQQSFNRWKSFKTGVTEGFVLGGLVGGGIPGVGSGISGVVGAVIGGIICLFTDCDD